MEIRSVRGMNDVTAPEIHIWRAAESLIRAHFESFGYTEIKTPVVEYTALFTHGIGSTTDVVEKEMYTFNDRNNESLSLRPEGTASVVRAYLETKMYGQDPEQKLYYIGPMFRYERPQKGRYRQFFQYGLEIFGMSSAAVDAELIYLLVKLYEKFKLSGLQVRLNTLGCDACRPLYRESLKKVLEHQKENLCGDCQRRMEDNPLRVLDCKVPTCKEIAAKLPSMTDYLDDPCKEHFSELQKNLQALKVSYNLDKNLVRGLDYYNRTAFEITSDGLGSQNAVGGGGRYDSLVSDLGGPATPAVGYAGGFERLVLLLQAGAAQFAPKLPLYITAPDEAGYKVAYQLANELKNLGVRTEMDYAGRSMKSQMKRADKLGAQNVLIIGETELKSGKAVLRDMQSRSQTEIEMVGIAEELIRRLS